VVRVTLLYPGTPLRWFALPLLLANLIGGNWSPFFPSDAYVASWVVPGPAESGSYVSQTVSGHTFAVCSAFAEEVVKECGNITRECHVPFHCPGEGGLLLLVCASR